MPKAKEKIREFSRIPQGELQRILRGKREKLRELRFNLAAGKVKNVSEIRETKKDIARILTILRNTKRVRIYQRATKYENNTNIRKRYLSSY